MARDLFLSASHKYKEKMMTKVFKDISIFQGVTQFITDCGTEVRAHHDSGAVWEIYILEDGCFVYKGRVRRFAKDTPRKIWNEYCDRSPRM
jgi:hypothetical protein